MSGGYKKCDVCGKLKPEGDLEDVIITIKKCKDCELSGNVVDDLKPIKPFSPSKAKYSIPPGLGEAFRGESKV